MNTSTGRILDDLELTGNTTSGKTDRAAPVALLVIFSTIFTLIFISNTFVLICFLAKKSLRKSAFKLFMFNLSFSDLIVGWSMLISTLPFLFPDIAWFQSYEVCSLAYTSVYIAIDESTYQLAIISFSCLFSIVKPLSYKTVFSRKRAIIMIIMSWVVSVAYPSLVTLVWGNKELYNKYRICSTKTMFGANFLTYQQTVILHFFVIYPILFVLFFMTVCCLSTRIRKTQKLTEFPSRKVSKCEEINMESQSSVSSGVTDDIGVSHVTDSSSRASWRYSMDVKGFSNRRISNKAVLKSVRLREAVKTLTLLFVLQSVCSIPFCVYYAITAYSQTIIIDRTIQNFLAILLYSNSVFNPFIYSLRMKEIKGILKCKKFK